MLLESTPGFVCCNAPCTSLEASYKAGTKVHLFALPSVTTATGLMISNQTVCNGNMGSTLCAPGMRRYFSNGMGRQGGMMDMNMQLATMGMFGGGPLSGGRVIGGYGAVDVPGMGYMNVMGLDNMSDEGHVEEISMDDFMDTLIEALDTDADVFESDRQITSDPWFGKQRFSLGPNGIKLANPMSIFNDIYGNPGFGMSGMMGHFGPMGGMGQPGLMGGQFGAMGGMNPMMAPMMGSMPQNGMMGGMPSPTTMGNMEPTNTMGMGPSGMAGQGYYNSGMGGFQGGFNMGPTSPPSPFAFSMYGSYPQGYGHPVQGNGQPGNGPWAVEPGYPTQGNSTTEEQPAGQPISTPQHQVYPQYPVFPQQPLHQQQLFYQPRPLSHHNQQPGYYQPPQASFHRYPLMPVYRPPIEQLMQPNGPVQS